ncbi:MAG: tetratricopeptide repeat protein [Candidatus Hydrogenedentes bacterium]|nr:tetratricopeptide repeat protein [Candidatus Hydrogenedentota bacterium]
MKTWYYATAPLLGVALLVGCMSSAVGVNERFNMRPWVSPPSDQGKALAHYLAAIVYERTGNAEAALQEMEQVPALDEDALSPALRMIRAYLQLKNYEKALEMADRALKQTPDRANLWIVKGEIFHQLKRFDDAIEAFKTAIELDPENILGYGALVELQEGRNDLVAAIEIYEQLLRISPNAAGLYYQLALNLIRINDDEGAIAALKKSVELGATVPRAQFLLGILYMETGKPELAVEILGQHILQRPDDVDALDNLAGALAQLGRYDEALTYYRRILATDEAQPQHNIEAMYLALCAGHPEEAEKLAPHEGAPIMGTLLAAIARNAQGAPGAPLLETLDIIEGDLDNECSLFLNNLLYLFGHDGAGAWIVEQVSALRPAAPKVRTLPLIEARALMSMDRHADALPVLQEVLGAFPPDQWVHYYLAITCEELKKFDETEQHLQAYLQIEPDDPDVLNFLGYLYAEQGIKLGKAMQLLNQALAADPENPFYMDSLGWIYFKRGMADEAITLIQKAIYGMESDDAVLRDHLGDAYLLKGDVEKAVAEWERSIRMDPKQEAVQEKLNRHRGATPEAK